MHRKTRNLRHYAEVPQKTVSWSEKAQAGIPKQPVLLDEHEQQIKELKKENQQLRAMLQELLERLTPQQRDIQSQTPSREGEQTLPTAKAQRGRSKSRVGRSSSKKVTANSKTPSYTGAAPSQQSKTPLASQPVTAQDSAYAQMLSILRQERYTETQRLEKNLREEFRTVTNAIQTQVQTLFMEIHKILQTRDDEPKRRKPAD